MLSQPGKQTIAMHILPNISRSKNNQAMKFGQLLEHNMRTFYFEKCSGEGLSQSFSKNQNYAYLWSNSLKFYIYSFFLLCDMLRAIVNILKLN